MVIPSDVDNAVDMAKKMVLNSPLAKTELGATRSRTPRSW